MWNIILAIVFIILGITYVSTLANTLATVPAERRHIDPLKAWLLWIPIFNYFWYFYLVKKISEALYAEYTYLNFPTKTNPSLILGTTVATLLLLNGLFSALQFAGIDFVFLAGVNALAGIVCWIVYWIQISQHKKRLQQLQRAI